MDDRTHNTLDDLADLFLTKDHAEEDAISGPAPIKLPPKAAGQPVHRAPHHEPPEPTLGELDELTQELLNTPDVAAETPPASPPKTATQNTATDPTGHRPSDPSASDYRQEPQASDTPPPAEGAGPSLRLAGGNDEDDEAWSGRRPRPVVGVAEAVMLGNLPGMAGPWLTQYGQLLAQQHGAVAILHVDTDGIDLEVIEPTRPEAASDPVAGAFSGPSLRIPPGGFAGRDLIAVLDQLCTARVAPVRTVLVHLDPTPKSLPRLLDLQDWTLLSGADDAAVVAAYRLLKQLLDTDEQVARAKVGLMVVGSDHTAGQHAAEKLQTAAANFLDTPLELIGYQQKMIPARCRTLGHFAGLDALWPRLTAWLDALQPPPPEVADPEPQATPEAPAASLPELDTPVEVPPFETTSAPTPQPRAAASKRSGGDTAPDPRNPSPQAPKSPGPQTPNLFQLIDSDPHAAASIPGGLALEARCPSQPHTQLAIDAVGRLHLLHRHDSAEGDPPTPKEAIVELVAVRDWARQHRQLLQLTERTRHFDADADPVLHLFTDRADLSVNLVSRLGELLKLHLLRDVAVGDQRTYFCTPLSA